MPGEASGSEDVTVVSGEYFDALLGELDQTEDAPTLAAAARARRTPRITGPAGA